MPTPRPRNSNPDARPTTGGQRRREAGWRADDRAQAESNWERERRRRKVKKAGRPRKVQPFRRRAPLPLDLLASALEAGVSQRQIAQALGISRFDLNRALQQETVRVALDRGEADRRELRRLLRQEAAAQPPRHTLLATAAKALARALASGVAPGQAAADLGAAPSTITRALQRGGVPGAAEHLLTIRRGYDGGQERQRDCRRLLQEARGRPTA